MGFKDSYTTTEKIEKVNNIILPVLSAKPTPEEIAEVERIELLKELEPLKTTLSNDAFAVGEMIQMLIKKIEHARVSLQR